ncbi:unnamed protein product [Clonostachys solani]|uniref:Uncharacterized protein n=1 Tax=Clonostachys solani TaxID=160281 RepID=A0A9N9W4F5_9HYPO|nr:unnamed protein product [Clonostachys solani]
MPGVNSEITFTEAKCVGFAHIEWRVPRCMTSLLSESFIRAGNTKEALEFLLNRGAPIGDFSQTKQA